LGFCQRIAVAVGRGLSQAMSSWRVASGFFMGGEGGADFAENVFGEIVIIMPVAPGAGTVVFGLVLAGGVVEHRIGQGVTVLGKGEYFAAEFTFGGGHN